MNNRVSKFFVLSACLCVLMLFSACGATLKHVPSKTLEGKTIQKTVSIMVADVGDVRDDEPFDRIGQGASYWLPVSYYARDQEGKEWAVSNYIAQSLCEDFAKLGYKTRMANDVKVRKVLSLDESIAQAKKEGVDYLVTTKVKDAKTNFWGCLFIPFFEPVWTRVNIESQVIALNDEKIPVPFEISHKDTEWYFAKITIFDAIFDAAIFGRHWHSTAWGETVVSDALAEAALKISENIQAKGNTVMSDASNGSALQGPQKVQ